MRRLAPILFCCVAAAAGPPKELRWYPAGHDLNATVSAYRLQWLIAHLRRR